MITVIDKYVISQVMERRMAKGLSQAALAMELEVPTSFIAMIESGKYNKKYNVAHLNTIAKVLECSPKDFLPDHPM